MIEHLKWHAQSIPDDEYTAVKGLPADWMPQFIRAEVTRQADIAERYVMAAPVAAVGILAVNSSGLPIEVTFDSIGSAILRKATEEPDVMPTTGDFGTIRWG
jgi:hypothetical protein